MHLTRPDGLRGLKLHPLGRTRGRRQDPDQDAPTVSTPDSLPSDGRHRQRRRSEPAIAYMAKFQPCVPGRTDGLTGEDEDGEEELTKKSSSHTQSSGLIEGSGDESGLKLHGGGRADLGASSSSLSSTPNSPAPARSSLDSLDSITSDQTWATRRGLYPTKAHVPSNSSGSLSSSSFTISSTGTSAGHTDMGTNPKGSPPKEPLNWGTLKSCRGLHPNSWLKKDRRLSLTQQDNLEKEEEDKTVVNRIISTYTH